ncbi:MAG TPA: hypothetical protein PLO51_04030, partial [Candidatus Micrarchaeota archaeon]|nr:hypothetical protein [Candidatus Micrarchaeota archaeon]
ALIMLSIFFSGCIKQTTAADCAPPTIPADQSFARAQCYMKQAVYQSTIANDKAAAISKCNQIIASNSDTKEFTDVYRTCISQIASNLQDPAICDNINNVQDSSFSTWALNPLNTLNSQIDACKGAAKPPAQTVCGTTVVFILAPMLAVFALSRKQRKGRKKP